MEAPVMAAVATPMRRAELRLLDSGEAVTARVFVSESRSASEELSFVVGLDSVATPRGEVVVEEGLVESVELAELVAVVMSVALVD
jgi:hypothetical protein